MKYGAEVPAAVGRRYFEADDIPAQLELDEKDVVIKIQPWPFIVARPF